MPDERQPEVPQQMRIDADASGFTCIRGPALAAAVRDALAELPADSSHSTQRTLLQDSQAGESRRHTGYHITLIDRNDASKVGSAPSFPASILDDIHFMGVGTTSAADAHVVVLCPSANHIRLRAGLPIKHFHITLTGSGADNAKRPKSITSLIAALPSEVAARTRLALGKQYFLEGQHAEALSAALLTAEASEEHATAAWMLAARASEAIEHPLTMQFFAVAAHRYDSDDTGGLSKKQHQMCVRAIVAAGRWCEYGPVLKDGTAEFNDIPARLHAELVQTWSDALREAVLREFIRARNVDEGGYQSGGMRICERSSRILVPATRYNTALSWHQLPRCFVRGCDIKPLRPKADLRSAVMGRALQGGSDVDAKINGRHRSFGSARHHTRVDTDARRATAQHVVLDDGCQEYFSSHRRRRCSKPGRVPHLCRPRQGCL